jgi:hypothetical protein
MTSLPVGAVEGDGGGDIFNSPGLHTRAIKDSEGWLGPGSSGLGPVSSYGLEFEV